MSIAPRPESSPVWSNRFREFHDGGDGLGRWGGHFLEHDHPNRVDAALTLAIVGAPGGGLELPLGQQTHAAQQQTGNRQDQQQATRSPQCQPYDRFTASDKEDYRHLRL